MSTHTDLPRLEVVVRMVSRYRQLKSLRYIRHGFDLDHLTTQPVETPDLARGVPNPEGKARRRES